MAIKFGKTLKREDIKEEDEKEETDEADIKKEEEKIEEPPQLIDEDGFMTVTKPKKGKKK